MTGWLYTHGRCFRDDSFRDGARSIARVWVDDERLPPEEREWSWEVGPGESPWAAGRVIGSRTTAQAEADAVLVSRGLNVPLPVAARRRPTRDLHALGDDEVPDAG